jgi:sodium/potassium/calcium exchanger 6
MPTGVVFTLLLMLSFLMSLVWLLLIANEIVGVALFFGKVLAIPDTVMGLVVLAIGNSINDLAASVTIAREGFPSMAVAGAFAGPMFNVLAGIGLPMLIYTASAESGTYAIGKNTPIVWAAFAALLTSLVATLVAVPLAGFRITHQIGRGLLFWFFAFIALVIVMALTVSEDDAGIVLE